MKYFIHSEKKRVEIAFSLDDICNLESGDNISFGDMIPDNKKFEEDIECAVALKQFTEKLSEREQKVLLLYKNGMTQSQTAKVLGVSQAQISRTIRKMREKYKIQNTE